jgi:hypothetical protein
MRVPRTEAAVIKINRKMASLTELKDLSKDFRNFRKDSIDTFTLDDFGFDSYYKNNSFIAMLSFL